MYQKEFVLENENLQVRLNPDNGAITGIRAVRSGWDILKRPELGVSFRLLLPLPERRNNSVFGEMNPAYSSTLSPDGKQASFIWRGVESQYGGRHDIDVTLDVTLYLHKIVFSLAVDNRSQYTVENVYCPYLGELRHPEDDKTFENFMYMYGSADRFSLWPKFQNLRGYFGLDYPTQMHYGTPFCGTPMTPFCLLRSDSKGLYVGVDEPTTELVAWHCELRPGYESSIDSLAPTEDTIGGKDVAIRFSAVHVPYILPGEKRALTPVALAAFEGGWQQGTDIYKQWKSRYAATPQIPSWACEPHSWQQVHINSPEGELRARYADLVKIGEECAKNGVQAIQLVGWNDGGQDQNNPSHDTDPRLGTFEELRQAIADIQRLGVKVVLFAKFIWADRATSSFRDNLIRLSVKDPYGDYYMHPGYQYQTVTQLLDINTKRLIPMCFLSEEYLDLCKVEFSKLIALGADGMLFDECLGHSALLCFDDSHGHRCGAPIYANDLRLIDEFSKLVPKGSEFLMGGEACYDMELERYHISYHRSENVNHLPLIRYINPFAPLMTAVTGFNDRNMLNQCLMYRYIISYEPYNFKGRLGDFPLTLAYGQKIDRLRSELRAFLWDGEFRDECGASVKTADGESHKPYSVFMNNQNGRKCVVISNYDKEKTVTVFAETNDHRLERYRLVDDETWLPCAQGITLPPRSAAVVL